MFAITLDYLQITISYFMLHEVTLPIFMNNRKFKTKKVKNRIYEIRLNYYIKN
ncbi:MAG: hypothetical protein ACJAQS_001574 [Porticoccus sp.]|jgi:hypothetical protein